MSQERTEQATPKKIDDMRKKAQVAKSQDLSAGFSLLGMLIILGLLGGYLIEGLISMVARDLSQLSTARSFQEAFITAGKDSLWLTAPLLMAAMVLGVAGNLVQTGFIFSFEPLKPKLDNINPISGLKKIFSAKTLVNSVKAIMKFVILGLGAWIVLKSQLNDLMYASFNDAWGIYKSAAGVVGSLAVRIGVLFALIGVLDASWQRYDFKRQAKMTKQELKDEFKQTEGDPFLKAKLRERRTQISRSRMMQKVPTATLVITNPTHYAVALYYHELETRAPKVVAKGADEIALKIIALAAENQVPRYERPELARGLFRACELEDEIPESMFRLVAEVIALAYAGKEGRK